MKLKKQHKQHETREFWVPLSRQALEDITAGRSRTAGARPFRGIIDLMLAHVPKDKVESVYNRAAYMPRRIELAQIRVDLLMKGMSSARELILGPQR
ncbi:MAG: hypothetical protein E6Q98_22085 [Rhodospirillaceae bacterium]|nr:MAG: hypothetical protein E6Q98_22085 [Rhodospirillaceae bacterium]